MINIRTATEIDLIRQSCRIVKDTLDLIAQHITPGVSTIELDQLAEEFIRSQGAVPGFKGLYGFPATLCISVDDEVVHGIPGVRKLENGQIISVDVGAYKDGYHGDHARTFAVGQVSADIKMLMQVTRECLDIGIQQAVPNNHIGDIGFAIQQHAEKHGYGVVRELCGHGIGVKLHEEPQIPNYGIKGKGALIRTGMCLAIEPMINQGGAEIFTKPDKWTVCTVDGKPSAHFEHTIAVTKDGPRVLTK